MRRVKGAPCGSKRRSRRPVRPRLVVELLEDRTVMSGTTVLADAMLVPELDNPVLGWEHDHEECEPTYLPPGVYMFNNQGYLTGSSTDKPIDIALGYLKSHAFDLGLTSDVFDHVNVITNYVSDLTATTHLSFQQMVHGLEVANAVINVNISNKGEIINVGGGFVPGADVLVQASIPEFAAATAVDWAAQRFDLTLTGATLVTDSPETGEVMQPTTLVQPGASLDDIPAKLHYVPVPGGGLELAWNLTLRTPDGDHWYSTSIDASDGKRINTVDYVSHASYNVFAEPLEAPTDPFPPAGRSIRTDVHDPLASPFGWHDTNGSPGADFTDTRGNNVFAQEDRDANNSGGFRPNGGPSLNFDFPLDLTQQPIDNQAPAITNLFYWNNYLHDVHYKYGFTEAARNFQVNNYGKGGLGNDQVNADAQDGSGTNNANFATPPDGSPGRMQMFEWTHTTPRRDSDLDNFVIVHEYGHGVSNRLTGNASGLNATQSRGMGEGWSDWWGLMFTQKGPVAHSSAHGVATYLLGQSFETGQGIRSYKYTYDFNMADPNRPTIARYNNNQSFHFAGTLWCLALWDLNTLLVEKYGFDSNLLTGYTGSGPGAAGNKLALRLVMDGLKLQPNNPSFLQARDAILAADTALTGGANHLQIWTAFARRGLGLSAFTSSSSSLSITEAFDMPLFPAGPRVTAQTPTGSVPAPVNTLQVTFDRAINTATFTTADIVSFTGPGGSIGVTGVSVVGGSGDKKFDISFAAQSAPGAYTMVLGPDIQDTSGNKMDQNNNQTPGEVPGDQYSGTFSIAPPPPSAIIIDDGQTGYSEIGTWYDFDGVGYNNKERYTEPGGNGKAIWQVNGVPQGTFSVWATWMWGNTNATYQIFDGATLRATVTFNQSNEPSGPTFGNRPFQPLGSNIITNSGTVRVELAAAPPGGGWVLADAVRFLLPTPTGPVVTIAATDPDAGEGVTLPNTGTFTVSRTGSTASALTVNYAISGTATNGGDYQMLTGTVQIPAGQVSAPIVVTPIDDPNPEPTETVIVTITPSPGYTPGDPSTATVNIADNDAPPPPSAFIIDNGQGAPAYTETGTWYDFDVGYNNKERYTDPGSPNKATWQASGLAPGIYTVQATWMWGNADQAPYSIFDGTTLRGTVVVNQVPEPSGPVFGGRPFQTLGTFTINSGTIKIELGTDPNDWVLADAIRVSSGGGGAGGLGGFLDRRAARPELPDSPEAMFGASVPWTPMDPRTEVPDVTLVPLGVDQGSSPAPQPILDEEVVDWLFGHPDLTRFPVDEESGWEDPLAEPVGQDVLTGTFSKSVDLT
jgi:extracellular elastinolytic metalloproteinase